MANTQFIEESQAEDMPTRAQLQEEVRKLREESNEDPGKQEAVRRSAQVWKNQADYLAKKLDAVEKKIETYQDQTNTYRKMYAEAKKQLDAMQESRDFWRDIRDTFFIKEDIAEAAKEEAAKEEEKEDSEIAHLKNVLQRVHAAIKDGTHVRIKTALALIESCIDTDE